MARAAALPKFADSGSLAQQIALNLKQGPAFILVTRRSPQACQALLDSLSAALSDANQVLRLHAPDSSASLFGQVANALGLGLAHISAASLAKHLGEGNTVLLCALAACRTSPDICYNHTQ